MNLEILSKVEGIYKIERRNPVTFCHGNNMSLLRWMKDEMMMGYFHVGIVDPPYGIDIGKLNMGSRAADRTDEWKETNRKDWDSEVPTQEYWDLLRYVCRDLIIWGGNYFTDKFGERTELLFTDGTSELIDSLDTKKMLSKEIKLINVHKGLTPGRCFIVWDKGNDNMSFAPGELAITTFDRNAVFIRKPRNAQKQDGERRHPTQKPVYIYDKLHLDFVEKKHRVLDTHGGSFSHAIAAWKSNHELFIIDREEKYFNDGLAAFELETKAGRLMF